jgi:hypothetical protein
LPIPIIFLRETRTDLKKLEPQREVVDGQQRVRTLISYIEPTLLPDFQANRDAFVVSQTHNKELAGKDFSDLAPELQQRLLDYQFSVHILPTAMDDREVLQIFARMNATGVKLNPQELRNAEFFGEFKTSMYELASEQLPRWRNWKIFTEYNIARMEEVELTSEFALLMFRGIGGRTKASTDRAYREKDSQFPERSEVERRFQTTMDSIDDKLGKDLRFLPFRRKTLFYSLFALFYHTQFGLKSPLESARSKSIPQAVVARVREVGKRIEDGTAPEHVVAAVERRTTHQSSRLALFNYMLG